MHTTHYIIRRTTGHSGPLPYTIEQRAVCVKNTLTE